MSRMGSSERASEGDLVAATWIFEQIALRDGLHVDRSKVRRAVDEAAETFLGCRKAAGGAGLWKQGIRLGRDCRVIDGDCSQLVQSGPGRCRRDPAIRRRKDVAFADGGGAAAQFFDTDW